MFSFSTGTWRWGRGWRKKGLEIFYKFKKKGNVNFEVSERSPMRH